MASGGRATLVLSGELDMSSTDDLEAMIGQVCDAETKLLRIDLRRLSFMDCAGLHVLVGAAALCESNECEFEVIAGRSVERLLELGGLGEQPWLRVHASPAKL